MWVKAKRYENLYEVNELGEIKSLPRLGTKGGILKQMTDKDGYKYVTLCKNGVCKQVLVHRIVFFSFNIVEDETLQINHKNEEKSDNRLINLELVTQIDNLNYGTRNKRIGISLTNRADSSKKIVCHDYKTNEYVGTFDSTKEVERQLRVHHSHVSKCCKGKYKQCNGYKFEYM